MKKFGLLLISVLLPAFLANAVPARRGFVTHTLPDGTAVQVRLQGDEFSHYFVTDNNKPMLLGKDGLIRYALPAADGTITLSDTPVSADPALFRAAVEKRRASVIERRASVKRARAASGSRSSADDFQGIGLFESTSFPTKGTVHSLVFVVEYADVKCNTPQPREYFDRLFNQEGFADNGATGSVRDYFMDQSDGAFDIHFDVYGPVELANNRRYYGGNDNNGNDQHPEQMVKEAAELLKDEIDFSKYDYDNDGVIDNIFVVYAGQGEADGGSSETVWPHQWEFADGKVYNGKRLSSYCCVNEWKNSGSTGISATIGTFVHEFSHVLGLPDLYDTSGSLITNNLTPGEWSVLDYGPYNNDGRTPPCYSAFERNALGWGTSAVLDGPASLTLEAIGESNSFYIIPTEKSTEFFLVENRQQSGWDEYVPGHGMLIWHVDYVKERWDYNGVNNNTRHQCVDIVEANGNADSLTPSAMRGYTFPGTTHNTSFTPTTSPALVSWANKAVNLPLTDIAENDGTITFDVCGGLYDLAKPAAPVLTAYDNGTIKAEWKAVAHADEYLLNVTTAGGVLGQYMDFPVGNVLTCTIEGVASETEYFVTVTAKKSDNVSEPSDAASVTTPVLNIRYVSPEAVSGSSDDKGNLTLGWKPVAGATHYFVTVEEYTGTEKTSEVLNFGNVGYASEVSLPSDWTWTGGISDIYKDTSKGYYGESAPSLKFTGNVSLTSPLFDRDVKSVSFWMRGASANIANTFVVQGRATEADLWTEIATLYPAEYSGEMFSYTFTESIRQVRFVYNKVSTGNVAFDDLVLEIGGMSWTAVESLSSVRSTGTSCSVTYSGSADKLRFYLVAADDAGLQSRRSNFVEITSDGNSAIDAVEAGSEAPVEYYNLQGLRVENPGKGIYIVRQGSKVSKAIF